MYKRLHHQKIESVLMAMNHDFLKDSDCLFGGGTAISLALDEYRESVDIDFLCSSIKGYAMLRRAVNEHDLGLIFNEKQAYKRAITSDRYGIRALLDVSGTTIKIEFVSEGRIQLVSANERFCGVPVLTKVDMFAEKLLANADRWGDKSVLSRDIIDISMMIKHWGAIPTEALSKTKHVYGKDIELSLRKAVSLISDKAYFSGCIESMKIDESLGRVIISNSRKIISSLSNHQPVP